MYGKLTDLCKLILYPATLYTYNSHYMDIVDCIYILVMYLYIYISYRVGTFKVWKEKEKGGNYVVTSSKNKRHLKEMNDWCCITN